jgi:4-hydroxythreonine-4-phosphate dehydrogenase
VLVTALLTNLISIGRFCIPGHTDYLIELEGNALMLMVQDNLRVGLFTDHTLSEVASHLTEELIVRKIETIKQSLIQDFINKPKIAVLGLNPHCGMVE